MTNVESRASRVPIAVLRWVTTLLAPVLVFMSFVVLARPDLGIAAALITLLCVALLHAQMLRPTQPRPVMPSAPVESVRAPARLSGLPAHVRAAHEATAIAIAHMVQLRDPITGSHLERLCEYTRVLVERLRQRTRFQSTLAHGLADVLPRASTLHDVGKIAVPDALLLKPGPLTPGEFAIVQRHTLLGGQSLARLLEREPDNEFLRIGNEVALYHHERWDGRGYPFGLREEQIPASARIVAVADVYDALTSERPYKPAYPHEETRDHILAEAGKHFDADVVEAFLDSENDFTRIRATMMQPAIEVLDPPAVNELRIVANA